MCALFVCLLLAWGTAAARGQTAADFQFECVIVASPSAEDRIAILPQGIDRFQAGTPFYVEFWAMDLGPTNSGITCAFADLEYPGACTPMPEITHSSLYSLFPAGTDDGFAIDEFGGCQLAGGVAVEPEWARIGYIKVTPEDSCQEAGFALHPATSVSSAFGRGGVPTTSIDYGNSVAFEQNSTVPATSLWGILLVTLAVMTAGTVLTRRRVEMLEPGTR